MAFSEDNFFIDFPLQVCLIHDPRPNHEFGKLYTVQYLGNVVGGYPVRYINTDIDEMKICAIKSLKNDEVLYMYMYIHTYMYVLTMFTNVY